MNRYRFIVVDTRTGNLVDSNTSVTFNGNGTLRRLEGKSIEETKDYEVVHCVRIEGE